MYDDEYSALMEAQNEKALNALKDISEKRYGEIVTLIKDVGMCFDYEIIDEPIGEYQDDDEWLDQGAVGDSGDSFEGTICWKICEGKYFKCSFYC